MDEQTNRQTDRQVTTHLLYRCSCELCTHFLSLSALMETDTKEDEATFLDAVARFGKYCPSPDREIFDNIRRIDQLDLFDE